MTTEKIKNFNTILESFLLQITSHVGTTYHHYFQKLIKINSLIPIQHAITHLLPFKDQILKKDETYFYNENNYKNKVENEADTVLSEILRLKDIYKQLNDESKDNVWSIFQALLQLTIEYCELKNINI